MHQAQEQARLDALEALQILDTAPEPELDRITRLASRLLGTPIALVSLVDATRQWFKSRVGLDAEHIARDVSFCTHTIQSRDPLVIPDATRDPRFRDNPLVTGAPHVAFYAGAPIRLSSGHAIGSFCVIDTAPRAVFGKAERALLAELAQLVVDHVELRQLRRMGAMFNAVGERSPDAIICADLEGIIRYWSQGAHRLLGHAPAQAVGRPFELVVPPRLLAMHREGLRRWRSAEDKVTGVLDLAALHRDGSEIEVEILLTPLRAPDGTPSGFAAMMRDVRARKAAEAESARDRVLLDTVIEHLPAMLFLKDAQTRRYLLMNRGGEEILGRPREEVVGRTDHELFPAVADGYVAHDTAVLTSGGFADWESDHTRHDGVQRRLRTRRIVVPEREGLPPLILGITEDVTEWRQAQERSAYLANHDALTGAVNRARLNTLLTEALAERPQRALALLCVDLDRFKAVNDLFGHAAGDQLLVAVTQALRAQCGPADIVARTGGDEFTLLHRGGAETADALAARVVAALERPFLVKGCAARIGASVGIALAPADGEDAETLHARADLALYGAKAAGKGCHRFFEPAMDEAARERRALETDLREGVANRAIYLHFQPLACMGSGDVLGFEALARWHHPTRGPVPPDIFIRVAEESGLIVELGHQILRAAMTEAAGWEPPLYVAVNLSPVQLAAPGFTAELARLLAETGLEPHRLELEVTEGVLIRDVDQALAVLTEIKAMGVRIAMDDFGSGYSSLRYFRLFPFDKLKIDRSFIAEMETSAQALAVVQAAIGLGRGLGMPVVAEGVETDAQLADLRAEGCTQAQGYFIGRPQPIESFTHLITRTTDAPRQAAA